MLPSQVSHCWALLSGWISQAWPVSVGDGPYRNANLLAEVLKDQAQVWVIVSTTRGMVGIIVTNFVVDFFSSVQSLQILAFIAHQPLTKLCYLKGLKTLQAFASLNRCQRITAYTSNTTILGFLKLIGADTDYRYVELDIRNNYNG